MVPCPYRWLTEIDAGETIDILSTHHCEADRASSVVFDWSYSCNSNDLKACEEGCVIRTARKDGNGISYS